MSAYDDAVTYLDAEVHPRCDYEIYSDMRDIIDEMEAENAKLREELAKARDPQRIGGQADPSSFAYAIEQLREFRWQHATNDEDAIPYINNVAAAYERENAKLREEIEAAKHDLQVFSRGAVQLDAENARLRALLQDVAICASGNYCYDCPHQYDGCDRDERLRAEGIEVDE